MNKITDNDAQKTIANTGGPVQPRTAEAIVDAFKRHAMSRLKDGLVPHAGTWSTGDARRAAIRAHALRQKKRRIEFVILSAAVLTTGLMLIALTALILY